MALEHTRIELAGATGELEGHNHTLCTCIRSCEAAASVTNVFYTFTGANLEVKASREEIMRLSSLLQAASERAAKAESSMQHFHDPRKVEFEGENGGTEDDIGSLLNSIVDGESCTLSATRLLMTL